MNPRRRQRGISRSGTAIGAVAQPAAAGDARVALRLEIGGEFIMQAILQEQLHRALHLDGQIPPDLLGVLDLLPEVGYAQLGQQLCVTGHGTYPSSSYWRELGQGYVLSLWLPSQSTQTSVRYPPPSSN